MPKWRSLDFLCEGCGYHEERFHDQSEGELIVVCPNCEKDMISVWLKAPMGRIGGEMSDRSIASYQKACRERFVKKDIDDVRNSHGKLYDDATMGAAVDRMKKGQKPIGID